VIIREEVVGSGARVIFTLEFELHGQRQCYAELAWLEDEGATWYYRCGQKLTDDELPVPASQLEFRHFEEVPDRVLY